MAVQECDLYCVRTQILRYQRYWRMRVHRSDRRRQASRGSARSGRSADKAACPHRRLTMPSYRQHFLHGSTYRPRKPLPRGSALVILPDGLSVTVTSVLIGCRAARLLGSRPGLALRCGMRVAMLTQYHRGLRWSRGNVELVAYLRRLCAVDALHGRTPPGRISLSARLRS